MYVYVWIKAGKVVGVWGCWHESLRLGFIGARFRGPRVRAVRMQGVEVKARIVLLCTVRAQDENLPC